MSPYYKSIAAALAGALVTFLTKYNIVITDELSNAIEIILGALITGAAVYFAPRNEPKDLR